MGYAQTAAVGIVLLTGSTVYTELSWISCTSKFDSKVDLFFCIVPCFSIARASDGSLHDKQTDFGGSDAQTWENYAVLRDMIPRVHKKLSIWWAKGFEYCQSRPYEGSKSPTIAELNVLLAQTPQTLEKAWFSKAQEGCTAAGAQHFGGEVKQRFGSKNGVFP